VSEASCCRKALLLLQVGTYNVSSTLLTLALASTPQFLLLLINDAANDSCQTPRNVPCDAAQATDPSNCGMTMSAAGNPKTAAMEIFRCRTIDLKASELSATAAA